MRILTIAAVLLAGMYFTVRCDAQAKDDGVDPGLASPELPTTISEARSRAMLLHEVIRGTLLVVHRDLFDEETSHAIPSESFKDVFHEVEERFGVKLRWLVVNADVVNVDHQASDEFEKHAAKLLAADQPYVEAARSNLYRFAGPIRLDSQCLKCHVKMRTSNEARKSGLLISMPILAKVPANPGSPAE